MRVCKLALEEAPRSTKTQVMQRARTARRRPHLRSQDVLEFIFLLNVLLEFNILAQYEWHLDGSVVARRTSRFLYNLTGILSLARSRRLGG